MLQKIGKKKPELFFLMIGILLLFYFWYVLYVFPIKSLYLLTFLPERPVFMLFPKCGNVPSYAFLISSNLQWRESRE